MEGGRERTVSTCRERGVYLPTDLAFQRLAALLLLLLPLLVERNTGFSIKQLKETYLPFQRLVLLLVFLLFFFVERDGGFSIEELKETFGGANCLHPFRHKAG